MSEKINPVSNTHEQTARTESFKDIAAERHEVLREQLEHAEQQHKTQANEKDIAREATEIARESEKEQRVVPSPAERRRAAPSKKQRDATLESQLKDVQSQMNTSSRIISKIIHSKPIESASDAAASTIARPNALLSGSVTAFIGVTVCYFVAKYYGYQLSGFETITAFIFGWLVGILYDYFSVMIRGHRNNR